MNTSQNQTNQTLLDDDIPDKFKDKETGSINVNSLLQSYKSLEKKLSNAPSTPKSENDYDVKCNHGIFTTDKELNKRFFDKGFTNDQVQFIYDLAAEKMVPMIVEMANDFEADKEIEKLIRHYGGVEQWKQISRQLLSFGQKNLPADVLDSLSSSFEGVIALENMMHGKEPTISLNKKDTNNNEQRDLHSMMRDPKYWRDKDPSFVAKVTEGFKNLYD